MELIWFDGIEVKNISLLLIKKEEDWQKRKRWLVDSEEHKGGKTSPLEAKEDNRRATRQAPPRPFAMSNTSIRIFISMKYERFKKIVVFLITSLNSAQIVFLNHLGWKLYLQFIFCIQNLFSWSVLIFSLTSKLNLCRMYFPLVAHHTTATGEKWWKTSTGIASFASSAW